MTQRVFAVVCCVLLSAMTVLAQSRGAKSAKADPLTGTWTGEMTPENAPQPVLVTLQLKFDGKSAVSGTISGLPNPGEVKDGTFDPKTGALKLQLGKTGESAVLLVLEGTVSKGAATGRVSGEGGNGEFKFSKKM
jgi:hypothetical protein